MLRETFSQVTSNLADVQRNPEIKSDAMNEIDGDIGERVCDTEV